MLRSKRIPGSKRYQRFRLAVLRRDGYRCRVCGREGGVLEVDHVIPRYLGGAVWDMDNAQALCKRDHGIKSLREHPNKKRLTLSQLAWGKAVEAQRVRVDLGDRVTACPKTADSPPQVSIGS